MELASHSPGSPPELLAKDAPNGTLERFGPTSGVLTQRVVDERLVAAAPGRVHLLPKPVDQVVVEADSNPGLPGWDPTTAPRLPLLKSYSLFIVACPRAPFVPYGSRASRRSGGLVVPAACTR